MAINLLPEEYHARVKAENRRRIIVGFGVVAALTTLINIVLLAPSGISLASQGSEFGRRQDILEKGALFAKVTEIESVIRQLNQRIRQYRALGDDVLRVTPELDAALEHRPGGVTIRELTYSVVSGASGRAQLKIAGNAASRAALLAFSGALEKATSVESVESPVSNLLRETNIDFSLIVVFHPL